MAFSIPPRPSVITGSQFAGAILYQDNGPREHTILNHLRQGHVPDFMRVPVTIELSANGHSGALDVLPDYLCIGTDDDFLRVPMNPLTAQHAADAFGASLPTRKIVDVIWRHAPVKLAPIPMSPAGAMVSTRYFVEHNARIENARAGRLLGALVAGVKKDVVLTPLLALRPDRVAIYGWHRLDGTPIQRLNVLSHPNIYADYSHGVRLVSDRILVDGVERRLAEVLRDSALAPLVSDEGISSVSRVPTK